MSRKLVIKPSNKEIPYLISVATEDVAERYVESVEILGDSIEPSAIWLPTYPGHMKRLDSIMQMNLDPLRWWIFTDTADVTFQLPFPNFKNFRPGIIVCNEGTTHTNNFWEYYIQMFPIFTKLKNKPVYNCGTVAMPGYIFLEYIAHFKNYRNNYLPQDIPQMLEQMIFNMFVQAHPELVYEVPHLFSALISQYDKKTAIKREDGVWVDRKNIPYVVVHRNGDTKNL